MPKPIAYLDSTIPSAFCDDRPHPERARWREITRAWWAGAADRTTFCTSPLMLHEIGQGRRRDRIDARLALVQGIAVLDMSDGVHALTRHYLNHKFMPVSDAAHLAAAAYHRCDDLVSWNFKHMVNANKQLHLRRLNALVRLPVPRICSPAQLLEER